MKKAILLSCIGADTYKLIRDLCTPNKPIEKSFKQICDLLNEHLNPEPNVIVERYVFNTYTRKENESVADFVAKLRHLSRYCNFGINLSDMIRDRIVCGVNNAEIQRKLLAVGNTLTLDNAMKLAISIETATKNARNIHNEYATPINKMDTKECYRCGSDHDPNSCHFRNNECFFCRKEGHSAKMCRKKKFLQNKRGKDAGIKNLDTDFPEEEGTRRNSAGSQAVNPAIGEAGGEIHIYRCEVRREAPIFLHPKINDRETKMELDTGASCTTMGEVNFGKNFKGVEIHDTNIRLRSFTGEVIKPVGIAEVDVETDGRSTKLPIVVTPGNTPTLFGRKWLKRIKVVWGKVFEIQCVDEEHGRPERLAEVLEEKK